MIASILPGVREVRVPISVGYLYLISAMLLYLNTRPTPFNFDAAIRIVDAIGGAGSAGLLTASSFAAYLLGAVLTRDVEKSRYIVSGPLQRLLGMQASSSNEVQAAYARLMEEARASGSRSAAPEDDWPGGDGVDLRSRLLESNVEVFGEYDRAQAEAAFRANIPFPLALLIVTLACVARSGWILVLLVVPLLLFRDAARRLDSAYSVLALAVLNGTVHHPDVDDLRRKMALRAELQGVVVRPIVQSVDRPGYADAQADGRRDPLAEVNLAPEIQNLSDRSIRITQYQLWVEFWDLDAKNIVYETDIVEDYVAQINLDPGQAHTIEARFETTVPGADAVSNVECSLKLRIMDQGGVFWDRDRSGAWSPRKGFMIG